MDEGSQTPTGGTLDPLVAKILSTYPYAFTLASTEGERAVGYRIRFEAAVQLGWTPPADAEGLEHDRYDADAVQVIGWYEDAPVSTGRLVLPPAALPTQDECGLLIEPAGGVVDVGRMAVVRTHQSYQHAAFIGLLCRLYLEMRTQGYGVACGMMSLRARRLVGLLGLNLEVLGPDRLYWNEPRAPVRFALTRNEETLADRWADPD
ncbi:MAG: hypothetical protein ACHQE5_10885 [Actinomycetes bacterium]